MADKAVKPTTKEEPQKVVAEETPASEAPLTSEPEKDKSAEAFIQMRKEIKELKKQLNERQEYSPPRYEYSAPAIPVDRKQFYDAATGEFDFTGYDQAVQQRINQSQVQQTTYAREIAKEEADFSSLKLAYPQLDPANEEYDSDFDEDVASRYYFSRYVQGKNVSVIDIAKEITRKQSREQKKEEAKTEVEHQKAVIEKETAGLETGARTVGTSSLQEKQQQEEEEDILSWKTRGYRPEVKGYDRSGMPIRPKVTEDEALGALVQRLKKRPWKKSDLET